jgi:hypothetical protein
MFYTGGYTCGEINQIDTLDGLFVRNGTYELQPVIISWETGYDSLLEYQYKAYHFDKEEEPIIYFKNHDFLKKNITGIEPNKTILPIDSTLTFNIDGKDFEIKASGVVVKATKPGYCDLINNYHLLIKYSDNGIEYYYSTLNIENFQVSDNWFSAPKIIWIGDIDGDKLVDLIIDESDTYLCNVIALYLSSNVENNICPSVMKIKGCCDF